MDKTTNYNLSKPGYEEGADISTINENMDIIDVELENLQKNKESLDGYTSLANGTDLNSILTLGMYGGTLGQYSTNVFSNCPTNCDFKMKVSNVNDSIDIGHGIEVSQEITDILGNTYYRWYSFGTDWSVWTKDIPLSTAVVELKVYVSPTGSDSNSGSQSSPFKTLNKALSLASPLKSLIVSVADGIYTLTKNMSILLSANEYRIQDMARVSIVGNISNPGNVIINGEISVINTDFVFKGFRLNGQSDIPYVGNVINADGCVFDIITCIVKAPSNGLTNMVRGISAFKSNGFVNNTEIDDCGFSLNSTNGSNVRAMSNTGSGNNTAYLADGGLLTVYGTIPGANTTTTAANGGVLIPADNSTALNDAVVSSSMGAVTKMLFMNEHKRFTIRCSDYYGAGLLASLGNATFIHYVVDWSTSAIMVNIGFKSDGAGPVIGTLHNTGGFSLAANSLGTVTISGGSQANITQYAIVIKRPQDM